MQLPLFSRRALLSAAALFSPLLRPALGRDQADPILDALAVVRQARDAYAAAFAAVSERNPDAMRAADEAAERDADLRNALSTMRPTTLAGLHALIRFHAEDIGALEPDTWGALALRDLARAIEAPSPAA
jgi:hypothetical protein